MRAPTRQTILLLHQQRPNIWSTNRTTRAANPCAHRHGCAGGRIRCRNGAASPAEKKKDSRSHPHQSAPSDAYSVRRSHTVKCAVRRSLSNFIGESQPSILLTDVKGDPAYRVRAACRGLIATTSNKLWPSVSCTISRAISFNVCERKLLFPNLLTRPAQISRLCTF